MRWRGTCLCQELDTRRGPTAYFSGPYDKRAGLALVATAKLVMMAKRSPPTVAIEMLAGKSRVPSSTKFPPEVKAVTRGSGSGNMLDRRGLVHHIGTNKSPLRDRRSDPCARWMRRCDERVSQPVMEPSSPLLAEAPRTLRNACASAAARPVRPSAPPRASLRRPRAPRRAQRAPLTAPRAAAHFRGRRATRLDACARPCAPRTLLLGSRRPLREHGEGAGRGDG
jgi:hypothetical protein